MRIDGTLKTWNDTKGFGFIAPLNGGQDIFVHLSEYPRRGGKPRVGEALSFAIALNADGRKKAVQVERREGARRQPPAASARPGNSGAGLWGRIVPAAVIALMLGAGYKYFAPRLLAAGTPEAAQAPAAPPNPLNPSLPVVQAQSPADLGQWRCDGRQHCSEMSSCAEATFFLRNCPDVKMDGDRDGIPCEEQHCGH